VSLDLPRPITYLITTGECDTSNFAHTSGRLLNVVRAAVDTGVQMIQIREKLLTGNLLSELAVRVVEITRSSSSKLLINDRLDIALATGADGVHLTSTSLPVGVVRESCPDDFIVGLSVHTEDEALEAAAGRADFVLFGPVFPSPGKGSGVGLQALRDVCSSAGSLPVLAVGGIDESNARSVLDAGAAGFAAIRSLNDPEVMHRMSRSIQA